MKEKLINEQLLDNKKVYLKTIREYYKNGFTYDKKEIVLPHLSHDELLARYRLIKPIVCFNNDFYYLKRYNSKMMRDESFISDFNKDIRKQVNMYGAKVIDEFYCYHPFANMYEFTPTIADVLEQFPNELLDEANAFLMINCIKLNDMDLDVLKAGCHKSKVKALILK